jgi:hypothetical protein
LGGGQYMIVTLNQETYERCKEFAEKRIDMSKSLYAYRGEQNKQKMIEDIIIGSMGEFGVFEYLKSKKIEVSLPDLTIYENKRKSFSADMQNDVHCFHVKSQTQNSISRYGHSWLFQRSDKIISSQDEKDIIVLTSVNELEVTIHATIYAKDMIWSECKVPYYRHTKVAIYLDQLIEADVKLDIL